MKSYDHQIKYNLTWIYINNDGLNFNSYEQFSEFYINGDQFVINDFSCGFMQAWKLFHEGIAITIFMDQKLQLHNDIEVA